MMSCLPGSMPKNERATALHFAPLKHLNPRTLPKKFSTLYRTVVVFEDDMWEP